MALVASDRLIPAHAGKTHQGGSGSRSPAAHPRSRGENKSFHVDNVNVVGSSPLTRGKPTSAKRTTGVPGLIPAHAGKTQDGREGGRAAQAHPRSRGENLTPPLTRSLLHGSSPLTRGKRWWKGRSRRDRGLIPAHAGKTLPREEHVPARRAHPRSRGENQCTSFALIARSGSSPLTRGKQSMRGTRFASRRLIPAHAGKTLSDLRFYQADRSDLGKP